MSKIKNIASFIVNEHKEKNEYTNLPDNLKPGNIEEAYLAQNIFQENIGRGNIGGYKIALASKIQQELCGIDHPIAGGIFKNEIHNSPAEIKIDNFFGLGLEFELAMEISKELTNEMGYFDNGVAMGGPGMDEVRWLVPVYPDDVLTNHIQVLEARKSKSKTNRGILRLGHNLYNQDRELCTTGITVTIVQCRIYKKI